MDPRHDNPFVRRQREKLLADLDALGRTPEDVAATLRARKVYGVRGTPWACVIAEYLMALGWAEAYASYHEVNARRGPLWVEVAGNDIPHPVRRFMDAFDLGQHKDLERGSRKEGERCG